jgi:hypothetical protein
MIEAEILLATTGLLTLPDRSAVTAAKVKLRELRDEMATALDREDPVRLRVNNQGPSYFKRLAVEPNYEGMVVDLTEVGVPLAVAGAYQLAHQAARKKLMDLHPTTTLQPITGLRVLPADPIAEALYFTQVDTVESQRVFLDLQSGGLLPTQVEVFSACFPDLYEQLARDMREAMDKMRERGWEPPFWLDQGMRRFLKAPATGPVDVYTPGAQAPPPPEEEPPKEGAGGAAKINLKALEVAGAEVPKAR